MTYNKRRSIPPIIIVTGGAGCGKSTVAKICKQLGARVLDVDQLAHRLLKPGVRPWQEILREFCGATWRGQDKPDKSFKPEDFVDSRNRSFSELPWAIQGNGRIRRDKLAAAVFSHPDALEKLNKIMHPKLRRLLDQYINRHCRRHKAPLILDMAVYPAKVFQQLGGRVLWVRAHPNLRVQRLLAKKQLTLAEAKARIKRQWKDKEYKKVADFILPNFGSISELRRRVRKLWPCLLADAGSGGD